MESSSKFMIDIPRAITYHNCGNSFLIIYIMEYYSFLEIYYR